MSIHTEEDNGLGCVAVNKDSMYAVIKGIQSAGHSVPLIALIKTDLDAQFFYELVDKMAYRSQIGDLFHFKLTENLTTIEKLAYGEGQMYSVLGSGFPSLVPGTDRVTNSKTLLYFPFNPFNSSSILHKPPDSAIAVPWSVKCDAVRNSQPRALGFVAKGKFYYVCTVLEWVRPDPPYESHRVNLYIHDSKTIQTLGPFTIANIDITTTYPVRILPVYGASLQDEPQFLAVSMYTLSTGSELSMIVDLHALDSPPQTWTEFGIPRSIPTNERLDPSCRTRESNKRLFIAGVVSVVFCIAAIALWIIRWWRQRTKVRMDKIRWRPLVGKEKREAAERSKGPQALIQDDNEP
ncbi:hypothetical protein BGZ81_006992 [Podila clonocystis]|nr:hypothetical protein BGZ81_006992 [Podila clonocystis]